MSIGIWQLVLILLIVFVIFGAGKLPRVMGDIGKGVRSLKKGLKEGDGEAEDNPANPAPKVITSRESEVQTESKARHYEKQSD